MRDLSVLAGTIGILAILILILYPITYPKNSGDCPKCGEEYTSDLNYCSNCGYNLKSSDGKQDAAVITDNPEICTEN